MINNKIKLKKNNTHINNDHNNNINNDTKL